MYDKVRRILPLIAKAMSDGIMLDPACVDRQLEPLKIEHTELRERIREILDAPNLNLNSGKKQVLPALLRLGIDLKGSYTGRTLAFHEDDHEVIKLIRQYKKLQTKISRYGKSYTKWLASDGRIHALFDVMAAITGRMSCKEPNLQQVNDIIKPCFKSVDDYSLLEIDYAQIQMVILAEFSQDPVLCNAIENGLDVHELTARAVFHIPDEQPVTKTQRDIAKTLNYVLIFNGKAEEIVAKLKEDLGLDLPLDEAEQFRADFFERYSGVAEWHEQQLALDVIDSPWGRCWDQPASRDQNDNWKLNYKIQATENQALDESLWLMLPVFAEHPTWRIAAFIHDSVLLEVPDADVSEASRIITQCMLDGARKVIEKMPVRAEAQVGKNWLNMIDL